MSLFRDDFYSTKVSRWHRHTWYEALKERDRLLWVVAVSMLAGVMLCLLLLYVFGGLARSSPSAAGGKAQEPGIAAGPRQDDRVVLAAAKARPAVVSIISTFKGADKDRPAAGMGMGSGIIFEKSGSKARIATNNHVVEGAASYEVIMTGGERKKASLIGADKMTDLAVLEIDAYGIKETAEFGDSEGLQPGETAISIGNPLGMNFAQTVTVGVISSPKVTVPVSLGRDGDYEWELDVIQTDAAINQGNSGGALVSLDGKVIGINSLKVADMGVEGLGFAIPINSAKPILQSLIKDQKVRRPYIGVTTQDVQSFSSGVDVLKLPDSVKAGVVVLESAGPAKDAGLKTNDVIVELDEQAVSSTLTLRKYLYQGKKIGDKLKVTYYRNGKKSTATLTLAEMKDR